MSNRISHEKREFVRAPISTNAKITRIDSGHLADHQLSDKKDIFQVPEYSAQNESIGGEETLLWVNRIADFLLRIDEKLNRILLKLECESTEKVPSHDATIKNISGSGIGLILSEPIDVGELLKITMNLPGFPLNNFQAYGKVVRVSQRKGRDKGLFDAAVQFLDMSESDRDQVIAYSFTAQRKAIRTVKEALSDERN